MSLRAHELKMFIIYDLVFLMVAVIHLPVYLFRRKFHMGFLARLGFLPKGLNLDRPIWIHAVSVGEVMATRSLVNELRKLYPDKKILISTVTSTGNKIARGIARDSDFVTYLPLDFSFIIRCFLNKIRPSLFIIVETEIWPNLITYLYQQNIPTVVVNGRISDTSFRGYLIIKFLLSPILNKISLFCVQTERDAQRLISLGVSQDKINITGSMKFDSSTSLTINPERSRRIDIQDYTDLKQKLGIQSQEKIFIAGSTHPGEEEIVLNTYKKLINEFPHFRLIIAPRHPERAPDIVNLIENFSFKPQRISLLSSRAHELMNSRAIFILDTIGELISYYAIADIVFVGGSLVKKGGHNILEPASLGKPILFGPHMHNFRDIADLFLKNQAAMLVRNQEELEEKIRDSLRWPFRTLQFCQHAKELILKNQGATQRNAEYINKFIPHF